MTSMSSLSNSVTSLHYSNAELIEELDVSTVNIPLKSDNSLIPHKVDKAVQATPDEDRLVITARNRIKLPQEIEFKHTSPLKPGFPNAVLNDDGVLLLDGLTIYQYGLLYSEAAIKYGFESIDNQRVYMRFDIFFQQVQEYNAIRGIPLLNRTTMCDGLVDTADLLWVGRLAMIEEERARATRT